MCHILETFYACCPGLDWDYIARITHECSLSPNPTRSCFTYTQKYTPREQKCRDCKLRIMIAEAALKEMWKYRENVQDTIAGASDEQGGHREISSKRNAKTKASGSGNGAVGEEKTIIDEIIRLKRQAGDTGVGKRDEEDDFGGEMGQRNRQAVVSDDGSDIGGDGAAEEEPDNNDGRREEDEEDSWEGWDDVEDIEEEGEEDGGDTMCGARDEQSGWIQGERQIEQGEGRTSRSSEGQEIGSPGRIVRANWG